MKSQGKESQFAGYQNEHLETYNVNLACFMTQHEFLNSPYLVPLANRHTIAYVPFSGACAFLETETEFNFTKNSNSILGANCGVTAL